MRSIILCLLLVGTSLSIRHLRDPVTLRSSQNSDGRTSNAEMTYNWKVDWYTCKIDQFSYSDTRTYQMQYLYNIDSYKPGGPIFFYTGNEGNIEGFATATGIMWDLAPQFNAALVFAEHRFYGKSLPFQNESYSSIHNMGYLTSEQALADYAAFITTLKTPNNGLALNFTSDTPVIAFGGSYGGMLSAWFRMKYPHIVNGAWASSAPLLYVNGGNIPYGAFDKITTRTFQESGCNNFIPANAWNAITNLSYTQDGIASLNQIFVLDPRSPINSTDDAINLNYFLQEAIEYMAMVDYPYPSNFLEPMPGFPVQQACQVMNKPGTNFTDIELATMINQASQIYYNYTGQTQYYCIDPSVCGDQGTSALGSPLGWPWQECSEIVMMMCSQGSPNDFFWDQCGPSLTDTLAQGCQSFFGDKGWNTSVWNLNAIAIGYGLQLASTSNIILTQGHLDPWSGGGFQANSPGALQSRGIYALEVPGSAHHLDLRTPNSCDPPSVSNLRFQAVDALWAFINGTQPPTFTDLPAFNMPAPDHVYNCSDIVGGYPWGQSHPAPPTVASTTPVVTTTTTMKRMTVMTPTVVNGDNVTTTGATSTVPVTTPVVTTVVPCTVVPVTTPVVTQPPPVTTVPLVLTTKSTSAISVFSVFSCFLISRFFC